MGRNLFIRTGRLFARPSFLEGCARVVDMGATLNEYNQNKTSEEAQTPRQFEVIGKLLETISRQL